MADNSSEHGPHEDQIVNIGYEDEDSDFYDSDNDVEEDDDFDFEATITPGIDFGPHVSFDDDKSSSYAPTSEFHTDYSSEDGECDTYPEFVAERDMVNLNSKWGWSSVHI
ncbi:Uncharacterized protein Adt_46926 [Abeliophyllum distichum]|uniref:Uncharacterized protein n=1 Tax=Abeliophyllum distichum TaxID=126358 RepID=A0ABD1NYW3_9LAMI